MKKTIWISLFVLTVLIAGAVFAVREVTFAQYEGADADAQAALDNTVLNQVKEASPYTGGIQGFFFAGPDKQGRQVYVWTAKGKVLSMTYADQGLSKDKAIAAAQKPVWSKDLVRPELKDQPLQPVAEVIHATPGPVLPDLETEYKTAPSKFVWEIYGKMANGDTGYTYLDFKSGEVLWQALLTEPK
ncbi:hypothetical protein [Tumebacillus flagellatus]|uniref:PepSY domain-containing protein n=1 Tax=Tumebacillus flagellatus TaxID=1157490 RepID=A0A074LW84_9BACL|nr:hypothetical protein [Tumebacillus flagellatus]KEO84323.1 hypothetical protein EL26_06020 [Tumebacillus flagellatus]